MNTILLQAPLSPQETHQLVNEFPQSIFLPFEKNSYKKLPAETWSQIEVIFGNRLTKAELAMAEHLRWIHSPSPDLSHLCLKEIEERGNILITTSPEANTYQTAEFALACILAYAKNLFHWAEADKSADTLWTSQWRNSMWSLENKVFLQIGLGTIGSEIARRAKESGMSVWGIQEQHSFHPSCRTFKKEEMPELLPKAHVISLSPSPVKSTTVFLKKEEFALMQNDSILFIRGSHRLIDEKALAEAAPKFRGIILDAQYKTALPSSSPLWGLPNILITPDVACRPKSHNLEAAKTFRYNLREYFHGNYRDMRNFHEEEDKSFQSLCPLKNDSQNPSQ